MRHLEVSSLSILIQSFMGCCFSACAVQTSILSMQLFFFWLTLTEIVVLSFFHSFFLVSPVAWAIDLAVQGCKYHCGFSMPLNSHTGSSTYPFTHPSAQASSRVSIYAYAYMRWVVAWKIQSLPPTVAPPIHLTACCTFAYACSLCWSCHHQEIPFMSDGCHCIVCVL